MMNHGIPDTSAITHLEGMLESDAGVRNFASFLIFFCVFEIHDDDVII